MDMFSGQSKENSVMVAHITKTMEIKAAEIKECKETIQKRHPPSHQRKWGAESKSAELESCNRCWTLKPHGRKEEDDERTRDTIKEILSKIAPQWASWRPWLTPLIALGDERRGSTAKSSRSSHWDTTEMPSGSQICKDMGFTFKQDFCKADRDAPAAAWPKMEQEVMEGALMATGWCHSFFRKCNGSCTFSFPDIWAFLWGMCLNNFQHFRFSFYTLSWWFCLQYYPNSGFDTKVLLYITVKWEFGHFKKQTSKKSWKVMHLGNVDPNLHVFFFLPEFTLYYFMNVLDYMFI